MIEIYTDGGSENPGRSVSGFVAVKNDEIKEEAVYEEADSTSIRSELYAILMALRWAKDQNEDCIIFTDSQYCSKGVNNWVQIWQSNDWKKVNGYDPAHVDLWKKIYPLKEEAQVEWIRGHNGNIWNDYIDSKVTVRT